MKKILLLAVAVTIVTAPVKFSFAQSSLSKDWQDNSQHNHSSTAYLIAATNNVSPEIVSVSVISYAFLNISMRTDEGVQLWTRNINLPSHSYWVPEKLILDANGNSLISGEVYNSALFAYEIFVMRISNTGDLEWIRKFSEQRHYLFLTGMDANDDVSKLYLSYWFTVYTQNNTVKTMIETAKLDAATGVTVWEDEFKLDAYAAPTALLYDASGIYQTGYITDADFNYDVLTFKHDDNGNLLWQQTYSGDEGRFSFAQGTDLAINQQNKLVVSGVENYHTLLALGYSSDGNLDFARQIHFGQSFYVYNAQIEDKGTGSTFISCEADSFGIGKIYLANLQSNGHKVWEKYVAETYLNSMKIDPSGESVSILGSYYDFDEANYIFELHSVSEGGVIWLSNEFEEYPGYNAIADFVTPDGASYYFVGQLPQNFFRTDDFTARWNVTPLRTGDENSLSIGLNALVYPNPCNDVATLSFSADPGLIRVYDMNGRLFFQSDNAGNLQHVNTADWPAGMYFVKWNDDGTSATLKFVKQ